MSGRRTVIRGGLVLDPQGRTALQDLLVEDGRIVAIDHPGFEGSDDAEILSAADRPLIPGLVNAHTIRMAPSTAARSATGYRWRCS
jgi:dihydroorotase-like cyclic amidohydrolase